MKKRLIIIISIIIIFIGVLSIYRTFAVNSNNNLKNETESDINLSYTLKNNDNMNVVVNAKEEKYVDMTLTKGYSEKVKYGIYYQMLDPKEVPNGLNVLIDNNSKNINEEIISPKEEKIVTVIIKNNTDNNITISLGSIIGFAQGDINALLEDNMILIK
jgi:hypothetical protein